MSPVVFHYANVLFLSLIALIPTQTWESFGLTIGVAAARQRDLFDRHLRCACSATPLPILPTACYGAVPALCYAMGPVVRSFCSKRSPQASMCWPARRWLCSSSISATPGI